MKKIKAEILVRHFAAAKPHGHLDLVFIVEKPAGIAHFDIVIVGIGDGAAIGIIGAVFGSEHGIGCDQAIFQRAGGSDQLKNRTRLELVEQGAVFAENLLFTGVFIETVGIETGTAGQGQDRAGMRVHDDTHPVFRFHILDALIERFLQKLLDTQINRQVEIVAAARRKFEAQFAAVPADARERLTRVPILDRSVHQARRMARRLTRGLARRLLPSARG